jgi:hypothetical protein
VNHFHNTPADSDDDLGKAVAAAAAVFLLVLSAAAVFVVVWPWIPVVTAVVAGATLGITAGFAWFTRANGLRIGRPSKQVMGVAVAGAVTLEIIVALAPRAPQPKLRTLRAVLRESGGRSLGDTFHWFASYGFGSSASVSIQAIAIVLLLALQLGILLLLTRTCLRRPGIGQARGRRRNLTNDRWSRGSLCGS